MANGNKVTNADIFDRLESLRRELTKQIQEANQENRSELSVLRRYFERLDSKYNKLALDFGVYKRQSIDEGKTLTNKFVAIGTIGVILLTALSSAFFLWLFKKG